MGGAQCSPQNPCVQLVNLKDEEERNLGRTLADNIIAKNLGAQLQWVLKNYSPTTHEPRVLSYGIETMHWFLLLIEQQENSCDDNPLDLGMVSLSDGIRAFVKSDEFFVSLEKQWWQRFG